MKQLGAANRWLQDERLGDRMWTFFCVEITINSLSARAFAQAHLPFRWKGNRLPLVMLPQPAAAVQRGDFGDYGDNFCFHFLVFDKLIL
jgi:hypothetical protein